jgi:hypothetical protein
MANWSKNEINLVGAGTQQIVDYINSHHEPVPHPITKDPWFVYVDIAPLLNGHPKDLRGGLNLYHEDVPLKLDQKGATKFWCQTKGQPPLEAFGLLTTQHPGLTALIIWSIELEWVSRGVRIINGQTTVVRDGDFVLAEHDEPVHHWLVEAATPEAMEAMRETDVKVLVPLCRWCEQREDFHKSMRVRNSEIGKVKSIPGVSCAPFTLDEWSLLVGLDPKYYPTGLDPVEAAQWIKLCERRHITLTPQEIEAVQIRAMTAKKAEAVSFHEADRYNFYPTAQEIGWLLPLSTEERRKELQAALDKPEWTTNWPEWEERELTDLLESREDHQK